MKEGTIHVVETTHAPSAVGPYSQAVWAGSLLFVSGQLPLDPTTGRISSETIEGQAHQVLANIVAILTAAGLTLEHVVRVEIFLRDLDEASVVNHIYAEYFAYPIRPARQTVQVARLPLDARIEISCIAHASPLHSIAPSR
jgi:2-iminobutanoate/2-iminopropanoate deaminase